MAPAPAVCRVASTRKGVPSVKRFVFRYYGFIALVILALGMVPLITTAGATRWQVLLGFLGGVATFVLAVQKQKMEELRLFDELFARFNRRFDEMNETLNAIRDSQGSLSEAQENQLYDYFNLCGEEYLMYVEGYIHPRVWQAWKRGMQDFRRDRRIRVLWDKELRTGSYYDLTPEVLDRQDRSSWDPDPVIGASDCTGNGNEA